MLLASEGDPMVTVLDEVGAAHLEDDNRGQGTDRLGGAELVRPVTGQSVPRSEVTVEVVAAVNGADDAVDADVLDPPVGPCRSVQSPARLLERE
jgi:hypothetical protein